MSLPLWGLLMLAFGLVIYVLLLAFSRLDAMERDNHRVELAPRAHIPPGVDPPSPVEATVPVWSRPALYDWQESGEL